MISTARDVCKLSEISRMCFSVSMHSNVLGIQCYLAWANITFRSGSLILLYLNSPLYKVLKTTIPRSYLNSVTLFNSSV